MVIFDNGVVQQSGITIGNVYDINFLKQIIDLPTQKRIVGDWSLWINSSIIRNPFKSRTNTFHPGFTYKTLVYILEGNTIRYK